MNCADFFVDSRLTFVAIIIVRVVSLNEIAMTWW